MLQHPISAQMRDFVTRRVVGHDLQNLCPRIDGAKVEGSTGSKLWLKTANGMTCTQHQTTMILALLFSAESASQQ